MCLNDYAWSHVNGMLNSKPLDRPSHQQVHNRCKQKVDWPLSVAHLMAFGLWNPYIYSSLPAKYFEFSPLISLIVQWRRWQYKCFDVWMPILCFENILWILLMSNMCSPTLSLIIVGWFKLYFNRTNVGVWELESENLSPASRDQISVQCPLTNTQRLRV